MYKIEKELGWLAMLKVLLGLFVLCICCVSLCSLKTLQKNCNFQWHFFGCKVEFMSCDFFSLKFASACGFFSWAWTHSLHCVYFF
jgi:hypothetical protein